MDTVELTPALESIMSLASGHLVDDLYKALVLTAEEVIETRKAGAVSITLKIVPISDVAVAVNEDLKRKPPTRDPHGAQFFAMGDGLLRKSDPRQVRMEVSKTVEGKTELRVAEEPRPIRREVGN